MVGYNFQYVGVTADHEFDFLSAKNRLDTRGIATGITADMRKPYSYAFDFELKHLGTYTAKDAMIDVSADSSHRSNGFKTAQNCFIADVAGVPYFITVGEVLGIAVVPA